MGDAGRSALGSLVGVWVGGSMQVEGWEALGAKVGCLGGKGGGKGGKPGSINDWQLFSKSCEGKQNMCIWTWKSIILRQWLTLSWGFLLMAIGPIMSYPWNYWITGCEDTKRRLISLELLLELRKSMAKVRSLQNQNIRKVFSG